MSYIGNSPGVASQRVETAFTATSSQTVFTPSSGYTLGYCDVYQNGVKLVNGDDYTASDGATVTLATGAATGDSIVIVASFPRGLTDGYLKSEADAKYVALTGAQTVAGVKTFSSQIVGIAGTAGAPAITTTGDTNTGIFFPAADTIAFAEGGTEAMRLDSSGNMGLGTTSPSAKLHIASDGPLIYLEDTAGGNNEDYSMAVNFGAFTLRNVSTSKDVLSLTDTECVFYTDGSERMRLDSSGNMGVGTTSPTNVSNYKGITLNGTTGGLVDIASNGTVGGRLQCDTTYPGLALFSITNNPMVFGTNGTERARITSSGDFGIGTSSPSEKLQVAGSIRVTSNANNFNVLGGQLDFITDTTRINAYNSSGSYITFYTNASGGNVAERARFIPSGGFWVGTTTRQSTSNHIFVATTESDWVTNSQASTSTSANAFGNLIRYSAVSPNGTGNWFLRCEDSTTNRFDVRSNGGVANYSANNVNLSDRREKTNFAPAGDYLAKICAIPVQTFNYIDQNLEEDDGLTLGVVAQDVQAVAPELVMESNWAGKDEEPKMRLSVYQTDLQYALMKCIQEQQAIIEQLQADVATLKGTP
jgi:hypothetical protein